MLSGSTDRVLFQLLSRSSSSSSSMMRFSNNRRRKKRGGVVVQQLLSLLLPSSASSWCYYYDYSTTTATTTRTATAKKKKKKFTTITTRTGKEEEHHSVVMMKNSYSATASSTCCITTDGMDNFTLQLAIDLTTTTTTSSTTDRNDIHNDNDIRQDDDDNDIILWKRRKALSKAITLIENRSKYGQEQAELLLTYLLQHNQHKQHEVEDQRQQQQQQQQKTEQPQDSSPGVDQGEYLKNDNDRYTAGGSNPSSRGSFRVGIAGPPGAGKSTFIEALGKYVLNLKNSNSSTSSNSTTSTSTAALSSQSSGEQQQQQEDGTGITPPTTTTASSTSTSSDEDSIWIPSQLGVICIDPSSSLTGGSILGDKTRMMELSRHPRAYVRPAPTTSNFMGGLSPNTDDIVRILMEAAQYDFVIVETVGLGQSEIEVVECVDMLILLLPPASGDDIQGVKKGIVEVCDMIVITKADNDLLQTAQHTAADYRGAMNLLHPGLKHRQRGGCQQFFDNNNNNDSIRDDIEQVVIWKNGRSTTPVLLASSKTGYGITNIWEHISYYRSKACIQNGGQQLHHRRKQQQSYWLWKNVQERIRQSFTVEPNSTLHSSNMNKIMSASDSGRIPTRLAAKYILGQQQQQYQQNLATERTTLTDDNKKK